MNALPPAVLACCLFQSQRENDDLGIDPVTLLQWREACALVAGHEAEIWPGYRLGEIPALVMNPNVAEVLVRHPRPPAGYARFGGESVLGGEPLFVRRGTTTFDGVTDTSTSVGGFTTLVVTDRGARGDGDDAWNLAVMVHEGFHAWAGLHFKGAGSNELDLAEWPDLDAAVSAHLHLEGGALEAAMKAIAGGAGSGEPLADEIEEQALLFLAERTRRRARMPVAAARYEDGNELNEGLASYVEWRAYELWAEHGISETLTKSLPGLRLPDAFRQRSEGMVNMLGDSSRGNFSINGTAFGSGVVRRRGYFFGAAIGKLLDRVGSGSIDWKGEAAKGRSLTDLLREALGDPSDAELGERADVLERESAFAALVAEKEKRGEDGRRERDRRVAAVLEGAGTLLVIDLAQLAPSGLLLPSSWTPFGLLKIDDHRRLFSQSTTRFDVGGARIDSLDLAGVVVDAERRELLVRTPVSADALAAALSKWSGRYADAAVLIEAPAKEWSAECVRESDGRVRLKLLPAKSR